MHVLCHSPLAIAVLAAWIQIIKLISISNPYQGTFHPGFKIRCIYQMKFLSLYREMKTAESISPVIYCWCEFDEYWIFHWRKASRASNTRLLLHTWGWYLTLSKILYLEQKVMVQGVLKLRVKVIDWSGLTTVIWQSRLIFMSMVLHDEPKILLLWAYKM